MTPRSKGLLIPFVYPEAKGTPIRSYGSRPSQLVIFNIHTMFSRSPSSLERMCAQQRFQSITMATTQTRPNLGRTHPMKTMDPLIVTFFSYLSRLGKYLSKHMTQCPGCHKSTNQNPAEQVPSSSSPVYVPSRPPPTLPDDIPNFVCMLCGYVACKTSLRWIVYGSISRRLQNCYYDN